ncbi:MAG: rhomboid family intramembrane serine protease [Actinomycetota bacterium]
MKLKNSLTTTLIVVISGFFIVANYAPTITWGNLTLQDNLLLIRKAAFPEDGFQVLHGVYTGEWWRVLTVNLTHANWLHLGFNMLVFFQLGNIVEHYYGKARYSLILLVSAVTASFSCLLFVPANEASVGASGMIFGLFGVMLVSGKRMGVDYRQVLGSLVLNLIITFTIPNIAWQAHIGGLIGGFVVGVIIDRLPRPNRGRFIQTWE